MKKVYRGWFISSTSIPGIYKAVKDGKTPLVGTEKQLQIMIDENYMEELRNEED